MSDTAEAEDGIAHDCCEGCKYNAAQALDAIGRLDEVLARIGEPDPRAAVMDAAGTSTETTAYRITLIITIDDGTILRDAEAHAWVRRNSPTSD